MRGKTSSIVSSHSWYNACDSSELCVELSPDAKVLSASGVVLERISAAHRAWSKDRADWLDGLDGAYENEATTYPYTDESLERALRRITYRYLTGFSEEHDATRWAPDFHNEFEEIVRQALISGQTGRSRYAVLVHSLTEARRSRKFFRTYGSHMGIAANNICLDDVVAILFGGRVPIILRPLEQTGHFTYVAEGYVHGFMDGEAFG